MNQALAINCREKQRWCFMLVSSPMNIPGKCFSIPTFYLEKLIFAGGVASLANAGAIL